MWFFDVTTWQEKRENNEQITNSGQISHSARNSLEFNKMTGIEYIEGDFYLFIFLNFFWGKNGMEFMKFISTIIF